MSTLHLLLQLKVLKTNTFSTLFQIVRGKRIKAKRSLNTVFLVLRYSSTLLSPAARNRPCVAKLEQLGSKQFQSPLYCYSCVRMVSLTHPQLDSYSPPRDTNRVPKKYKKEVLSLDLAFSVQTCECRERSTEDTVLSNKLQSLISYV
jgi:hypothetical protein